MLAMKIFLETVAYACRFILRLRDRSGNREVAREIETGVGQRLASKKRSALNLRNLFFKTLSFNVATSQRSEVGIRFE